MSNHGTFSGNPTTEWLVDSGGKDRDMRLLDDFSFTEPGGRIWWARKNEVVNGASIPRPLWSSVGSPYTDDYRRASVVHDVACHTPGVSRKEADVMFFHACRAGGCGPLQAQILYAGVRIGAWVGGNLPEKAFSAKSMLFSEPMNLPSPEAQFLQGKLADISSEMKSLPEDATVQQMDDIIENHLKF